MTADALEADVFLDRIRTYRESARRIVEADWVSVKRRCVGLLELSERARAETDLTIRTWAERAVWEESKSFLGVDDDERVAPSRSYEAAQRQLRSRGLEECPTCRAGLATEDDFVRWSRLRIADAERRDVREKAVR